MNKEKIFKNLFYIDDTSPSGVRWNIEIRSGKNNSKVEKSRGDVAGVASKNCRTHYWSICFTVDGKKCYTTAHTVLWTLLYGGYDKPYLIDHIDGDGLNNKIENLRLVTYKENSRNQRKSVRNKSGHVGVYLTNCNHCSYWMAYWREFGKNKAKCFRIDPEDSESYDRELQNAIAYREGKLEAFEGWTERHGK